MYSSFEKKFLALLTFSILFTGSLGLGFNPQPVAALEDPLIKTQKNSMDVYGPPQYPPQQNSVSSINSQVKPFKDNLPENAKFSSTHLPFIENLGQVDNEVKYYAKTFAGTVFVNEGGLTYALNGESENGIAIKERFLTVQNIQPQGIESSATKVNYFVGDEQNWRSNVPTFEAVSLGEVWPNVVVDLKAYGNNVEKIFNVLPSSSPDSIRMHFDGITNLEKSSGGDLLIETELGSFSMLKPVAYQIIGDVKKSVDVEYIVESNSYGFVVGEYNESYPLIIDPLLASTYLGGTGVQTDRVDDIVTESNGNILITGRTGETDFPTTLGAFNQTSNGGEDVFVTRLNSDLTSVLTSTYIGGSSTDRGLGIEILDGQRIYVAGVTSSSDYPTAGAGLNQTKGLFNDGFVTLLSSDLSSITLSGFFGGSGVDSVNAIELLDSFNVYIAGSTSSPNFPIFGGAGFDGSYNAGGSDAFVVRIAHNATFASGGVTTFLGGSTGSSGETINDIVYHPVNQVLFVTGKTFSSDFPTTIGAFNQTYGGQGDVFVSGLSADLTSLGDSTYIGGTFADDGRGIGFDNSLNIFVTGLTVSSNYPTTAGAFDQTLDGNDVFVTKLPLTLDSVSASTFVGGSSTDQGFDLAMDENNEVLVTGITTSTDFPVNTTSFSTSNNGGTDGILFRLSNDLSTLQASTYIGGSGSDQPQAVFANVSDKVIIGGLTTSTNYPTTAGAFSETILGSNIDAFVTILTANLTLGNSLPIANDDVFTTQFETQVLDLNVLANDTDSDADALTIVSISSPINGGVAVANASDTGINYTPADEFRGVDRFNYTITDGVSGNATATVDVVILGTNGQIAFERFTGGNLEIFKTNSDGGNQVQLTNNAANDGSPSWSPNGTQIAFMSTRDDPSGEIYLMNADGSGQTNLTNSLGSSDNFPDWSPDGTRIAFATSRDGDTEVYVMNADGSGPTNLSNDATGTDTTPNWSPNGTKIAFASTRDGNAEIYVMDADGSGQKRLTNNAAADQRPNWSPDGTKILFQSDRDGNQEVYVMSPDGSGQTNISNNAASDIPYDWSPDGTKIVFQTSRDLDNEVYVMNADGSGATNISNNIGSDQASSWGIAPNLVNTPPVANDDFFSTVVNGSLQDIDVLANDTDADFDALNITGVTAPINGGSANANGSATGIDYTTPVNFRGVDVFNYTVFDGNPNGTDVGTVSVAILGVPGQIAFDSNRTGIRQIFSMNSDGTNPIQLTFGGNSSIDPSWSPNGTKIAYVNGTVGDAEIFVMNADGSNQKQLTNNAAFDGTPSWSPFGDQITFISDRDGNTEVYVMNSDGSGQTNISNNLAFEFFSSWSPDGTKIAFVSDRDGNFEIYVMDADGSDQTNISNNVAFDDHPRWSPDGTKIAFDSDRDDVNKEVYVMNADGSNAIRVTNSPNVDEFSNWSPDGTKLVFETLRDGNWEVYSMDADGNNLSNLTNNAAGDFLPDWGTYPDMAAVNNPPIALDDLVNTTANTALNNINVLANDTDVDFDVLTITAVTTPINNGQATINATNNGINFTPDTDFRGVDRFNYTVTDGNGGNDTATVEVVILGTNGKIVFTRSVAGNNEIYVMNSNASNPTRLTNNVANDWFPKWSPDGTEIVFWTNRDGNDEVYKMNADGSNLINLTNNSFSDELPNWSPNGTKISFNSDRDGNDEIYIMNADGTGQTRLTNSAGLDANARWSPDGTKFAFSTNRDGNFEIYTMNADGTNQVRLTNDPATDGNPSWSPDGKQIYFHTDTDAPFVEIYKMNADGTNKTRLTFSPQNGYALVSFSPDGTKLIVHGNPGTPFFHIFTMNPNGGNITQITNAGTDDVQPDWGIAPDMAAPVNNPPVANNDFVTTQINTAVNNISVLDNDSDADLDALTITAVTTPINNGIATINATNSGINFTPDTDFRGVDVFNYTVSDGNGGENNATVRVTMLDTNGRIAFHNLTNGQIFLMNSDGSNIQNIPGLSDNSPAWSANGSKIAFSRNGEIHVMEADGTNVIQLTSGPETTTHPTWSPDGSKIAFRSIHLGNEEIHVIDGSGFGPFTRVNLTSNASVDQDPSWSPDGTQIAFHSDRTAGGFNIYLMNADGTNQVNITGTGAAFDPTWSPNGTKIIFRAQDGAQLQLRSMNTDGSDVTVLSSNIAPTLSSNPSFSPDGTKIAFDLGSAGTRNIHILNSDGTFNAQYTNTTGFNAAPSWGNAPDFVNTAPVANDDVFTTQFEVPLLNLDVLANDTDADFDALTITTVFSTLNGGTAVANASNIGINFTPAAEFRGVDRFIYTASDGNGGFANATVDVVVLGDNGKILFDSNRDGNDEIYAMNSDGSVETNLSNNAAIDSVASWSPNGTKVAFTTDRDGNNEIYVMDADGSNPKNISNNLSSDATPSWSPNGTKFVFQSFRDGNNEIYTMNTDGSSQTRLTNNAAPDFLPRWSPDGTQIAFVSDRDGNFEIYVMNADGSNQTNITNDSNNDLWPKWSPDGEKITFYTNRTGNPEIFTVNPDGSNPTNISNHASTDFAPGWSPNGTKITFSSDRNGPAIDVYTMDADGSNVQQLTGGVSVDQNSDWGTAPDMAAGNTAPVANDDLVSTTPVIALPIDVLANDVDADLDTLTISFVSPTLKAGNATSNATNNGIEYTPAQGFTGIDTFTYNITDGNGGNDAAQVTVVVLGVPTAGTNGKITFHTDRDGNNEIYVMNSDGSLETNISNNVAMDTSPSWSPNGTKIAFDTDRDGQVEIYTMNADGTGQVNLTNHIASDFDPSWSPNGTKIVFWSTRDGGNLEIYTMNSDGSDQTNISNNAAVDLVPKWSPDGTKIVFISVRDGNNEIYIMNSDGSVQTNISNNTANDDTPSWSPDSSKIAFVSNRDGDFDVYSMNVDGTNVTQLTNTTASEFDPSWSPDGNEITFRSIRDGNYEIYVMDSDGSNQTRYTNNTAFDGDPDWGTSPNTVDPLVSHWKAEGDATDSQGVNNGTINGPVGFAPGLDPLAFDFTIPGISDYVIVNPVSSFPSSAITTSLWMKTTESNQGTLISYAAPGGSTNQWIIRVCDIGSPPGCPAPGSLAINRQNTTDIQIVFTNTTVNDGLWHHVAATWNDSDGVIEIYLDGTQLTTSGPAGVVVDPLLGGGALVFGQEQDSIGGSFDAVQAYEGYLDEIEIYNTVLSASQIASLANVTVANDDSVTTQVNVFANNINVLNNDSSQGALTITSVSSPINGGLATINATNNGINFIPALDFRGVDVFNYTITNGTSNASATVNVAILGTNGKIAFASNRDGGSEIFTMNANGTGPTNISNNGAGNNNPSWSPDGTKIAFRSTIDSPDVDIYTMNSDGSNQTNITNTTGFDIAPSWSPDGTKIAFHSARDGNAEIYSMNADGSNQVNLTNNVASDGFPSWSPDGTKIAFDSNRDGNGEIYVMNADGSGQINLSNDAGGTDNKPSWSPDGTKIVFDSDRDGNNEVYVMNADGSGQTRLTNNAANDFAVSWSPDGTKIVFESLRDGNNEVYVMNADGSNQTNITNNVAFDGGRVSWGTAPETAAPINPLVSHWKAEGDATDAQGVNNGTITGPVGFDLGLDPLSFDFTTPGISDYVIVNPVSSFPTDEITSAFWIKSAEPDVGTIFSYAAAGSQSGNEWFIWLNGTGHVEVFRNVTISTPLVGSTIPINDGFWHHVAATWESTTGTIQLYIDGTLDATSSPGHSAGIPIVSSGSLVFGQDQDTIGGGFNAGQAYEGFLDEVYLYNTVLSPAEIASLAGVAVANEDYVSTQINTVLNNIDVLPNDAGQGSLTITSVSASLHGGVASVNFSSNGIDFTPLTDFRGIDVINYTITDSNANNASASLNVAVLGENGQITFHSNRTGNNEIFVMNSNGSNPNQLTNNLADDNRAKWSSNGTLITFTSDRDGNDEIYIMKSNGTEQNNISNNLNSDTDSAISPDGATIAFVSNRTGSLQIWTMDIDGNNQQALTNLANQSVNPTWSPDGTQIAFINNATNGDDNDIFVMNADGTNISQITFTLQNEANPEWSPDGTKIVYAVDVSGDFEIRTINPNGTGVKTLTNNGIPDDTNPAWSPDGTKIVFSSDRDGDTEVYTMNRDGSNQVRITTSAGIDQDVHWGTAPETAPNTPPVANPGQEQVAFEGDFVTLNGTASFDPDFDPLTFQWTQTAGANVTLDDSSSALANFTVPSTVIAQDLVFELEVSDGSLFNASSVRVKAVQTGLANPAIPLVISTAPNGGDCTNMGGSWNGIAGCSFIERNVTSSEIVVIEQPVEVVMQGSSCEDVIKNDGYILVRHRFGASPAGGNGCDGQSKSVTLINNGVIVDTNSSSAVIISNAQDQVVGTKGAFVINNGVIDSSFGWTVQVKKTLLTELPADNIVQFINNGTISSKGDFVIFEDGNQTVGTSFVSVFNNTGGDFMNGGLLQVFSRNASFDGTFDNTGGALYDCGASDMLSTGALVGNSISACTDVDTDVYVPFSNQTGFPGDTIDCNDGDEIINPSAIELFNGADDNCIGGTDETSTDTTPSPPAPTTATLNVTKIVINDDGGTAIPSNFTITVTGNNTGPFVFPGNSSGILVTLDDGPYDVTETGPAGYIESQSAECFGEINAGETRTCIITNDDESAAGAGGAAPIADAGLDFSINEEVLVTLDASQSRDLDGDSITYSWKQTDLTPLGGEARIKFENNLVDSSGNGGNDGTVVTGTTTFVNGNPGLGKAFSFDGATQIDLAGEGTFDFDASQPFSISVWFKTTSTEWQVIAGKTDRISATSTGYAIYTHPAGSARFLIMDGLGETFQITHPGPFNDGLWHHAVARYDGSGLESGMRLYVDAEPQSTPTTSPITNAMLNDEPFSIGAESDGGKKFIGEIDELRVYPRLLSDGEIEQLFGGSSEDVVQLKFEDNLDDNSDSSPNDGTVVAGTTTFVDGHTGLGKAFSFNGATQIDLFDEGTFDFDASQPFSISVWFKTTSSNWQWIAGKGNSLSGSSSGYSIYIHPSGDMRWSIRDASGETIQISSIGPFNDGQWHHAVGTYDGSGLESGMILYLDSVRSVVSSTTPITNAMLNDVPFSIGAESDGGKKFDGEIDELQVFPSELTRGEVGLLFSGDSRVALVNDDTANPTFTAHTVPNGPTHKLSFELTVSDADGSNSDIVSVFVRPVNSPPVSVIDNYGPVDEDGSLTVGTATGVLSNDNDVDGASLTAVLESTTPNGILTLNTDGSFTYIPNENFEGPTDTFTYKANDGFDNGNIATVTISINPLDDPPAAGEDQNLIANEGSTVTLRSPTSHPDTGETLTFLWEQTSGTSVTLNPSAIVEEPTFTAPSLVSGSEVLEFSLTVTDLDGDTDVSIVQVEVFSVAVTTSDAGPDQLGVIENTVVELDGSNSGDPENNPLDYSWIQLDVIPIDDITRLKFEDNLTDTSVSGGNDGIVITGTDAYVNGAPGLGRALTINADTQINLLNEGTFDFDASQPFSISVWFKTTSTEWQWIAGKGTSLSASSTGYAMYSHPTGEIRFIIMDGLGDTLQISNPTPFNDGVWHHAVGTYDGSGLESGLRLYVDTAAQSTPSLSSITNGMLNDDPFSVGAEADGGKKFDGEIDSLRVYQRELSPSQVDALFNGEEPTISLTGELTANPTFTAPTVANGQTKTLEFELSVFDPVDSQADMDSMMVTVIADNEVPGANPDSYNTPEDTSISLDVRSNDTDQDGDSLTIFSIDDTGTDGTVTHDGLTIEFSPTPQFNGITTFEYTIDDGFGGTNTTVVTVTVSAVNDPPFVQDDEAAAGNNPIVIDVLLNDIDQEDPISIFAAGPSDNGAGIQILNDKITYTPPPIAGPDSFPYTADDGNGGQTVGTVNVIVNDVSVQFDSPNNQFSINTGSVISVFDQFATDVTVNIASANGDTTGFPIVLQQEPGHPGVWTSPFVVQFSDQVVQSDAGAGILHSELVAGTDTVTVTYQDGAVVEQAVATIIADPLTPIGDQINATKRFNCDLDGGDNESPVGDKICTDWEDQTQNIGLSIPNRIYDNNGNIVNIVTLDVPCMSSCPSPTIPDIFVEIDWMTGHEPPQALLDEIEAVFAAQGIQLHLFKSESVGLHQDETTWSTVTGESEFDAIKRQFIATEEIRLGADSVEKIESWRQVFYYILFAHALEGDPRVSGIAERPGNDGMVTLGNFENGVGRDDQIKGTLMHEIGHMLGLRHGGGDDINYKPNYLSVMQYGLQFKNYDPNRVLDFSQGQFIGQGLFESNLFEDLGLTGNGETIVYGTPTGYRLVTLNGQTPINWNDDRDINGNDIITPGSGTIADINNYGGANPSLGEPAHFDYDDWANLDYDKVGPSTFYDGFHNIVVEQEFSVDAYVDTLNQVNGIVQSLSSSAFLGGDATTAKNTINTQTIEAISALQTFELDNTDSNLGLAIDEVDEIRVDIDHFIINPGFNSNLNQIMDDLITALSLSLIAAEGSHDGPFAQDDTIPSIAEDSGAHTLDVLANDDHFVTGTPFSIVEVTNGKKGTVEITNSGADLTYTLIPNKNGPDSFTYTIEDPQGERDTALVRISITKVNDDPIANDDAVIIINDLVPVVIEVIENDNDIDGDDIVISSVTNGAKGNVANGGDDVIYTRNLGETGADSFTYTLSDFNFGSDSATVTIVVDSDNDGIADDVDIGADNEFNDGTTSGFVVNTGDQTILVTEIPSPDGVAIQSFETGGTIDAIFNVCNDAADILLGSGEQVEVTCTGTGVQVVSTSGTAQVDLNRSGNVLASVSLTVGQSIIFEPGDSVTPATLSAASSNSEDVLVDIVAIGVFEQGVQQLFLTSGQTIEFNEKPTAVDDNYVTDKNVLLVEGLPGILGNDIDINADELTATLIDGVKNGGLTLLANGSFTYQPVPGFVGIDTFTYKAEDGITQSDNTATVSIDVQGTPDFDAFGEVSVKGKKFIKSQGTIVEFLLDNVLVKAHRTDGQCDGTVGETTFSGTVQEAFDTLPKKTKAKFMSQACDVFGTPGLTDTNGKVTIDLLGGFDYVMTGHDQDDMVIYYISKIKTVDPGETQKFNMKKFVIEGSYYAYAMDEAIIVDKDSILELTYPDYIDWFYQVNNTMFYPFVLNSTDTWEVDMCVTVPEGYVIIGNSCQQVTVEQGENVVIFEVEEVGSPDPDMGIDFTAKKDGKGKGKDMDIQISGKKKDPLPPSDTVPPIIKVPDDRTVTATDASGAVVWFWSAAVDLFDGQLRTTCTPPPGSTFPIGTTTVTCEATDAAGNTGSASFDITVLPPGQDTVPPVVRVPADKFVDATDENGAIVWYLSWAVDDTDGLISSSCTPPPGSIFPIGTTTVTCEATDAAGNTGSATFNITVQELSNDIFPILLGDHSVDDQDEADEIIKLKSRNAHDKLAKHLLKAKIDIANGKLTCEQIDSVIFEADSTLSDAGYEGPNSTKAPKGDERSRVLGLRNLIIDYNINGCS